MKSIRIRSYYSVYFPAFSLNTDQNNSEHGYFLQSGVYSFPYCYYIYLQKYFQLIRWKIRFHNQHIMWCNFPKNQNNQKDVFFFFCFWSVLLLTCVLTFAFKITLRHKTEKKIVFNFPTILNKNRNYKYHTGKTQTKSQTG